MINPLKLMILLQKIETNMIFYTIVQMAKLNNLNVFNN